MIGVKIVKTKVLIKGIMVATIVALPKVILFFISLLNRYIRVGRVPEKKGVMPPAKLLI
ncbi:unnamed protein product [marine sediment metagenome]|uniref:Uncharacterized protein n=1 Tax=marine sediment metagenome TaxID=412755 RepID=X0SNH0_9ZZZZ